MRRRRRLLVFLLSVVLLPVTLGLGLSHMFTRRRRPDQSCSPAQYGLPFEEVAFPARDGVLLRGWWIPAPGSERAVIFLHGYGGSMDPDLQYVPAFHEAGFNVLMFDFRNHGRSEGQITTAGYLERQDVLGAVDFVRSRGIERIGLLGFSMGGMVAMLTAPLCPQVGAVISDGGPARMCSALRVWGTERGLPRWLAGWLAWLVLAATSLRVRANLFRYEPVRWVGQLWPRPILFIHGDGDPYLPPEDLRQLVAAAGPEAQLWRVPEAGHRNVDHFYPQEYRRRCIEFFTQHL